MVYNLPDGATPHATAPDDTIALLAENQTFTNKYFDDAVNILSTGTGQYSITPQDATGNRTLLLPDAMTGNDEITLNAHPQTLSSKTLVTPKIQDLGTDHDYVFAPSNLAADRNITLPVLTADDTFVFETHTQTLENKTLDLAGAGGNNTINGISNANIAASGTANIALNKLAATTANVALKSDASGYLVPSLTTDTELEYLSGVTSAIQTQINSKAGTALDNLTIASLAAEDILIGSSSSAVTRLGVGLNGQVLTVSGGAVVWDNPAGTGDVVGPGSSTDNALARYDLTTGKVLQNSGVILDDSDNLTGIVGLTASATVQGGTITDGSLSITSGDISGAEWIAYDTTLTSNQTMTTGTATFHPEPTIDTGVTVTVDSGAKLVTGTITVNGTLTINGTHRVI